MDLPSAGLFICSNRKEETTVIKILYISAKRGKEFPLLSHLEECGKLTFKEGALHLRSKGISLSIRNIFYILKTSRNFKPDLVLVEGPGFLSVISILIKKIYKLPLIVRVKGDLWKTYSEINHNLPLYEKFAKFLNYKVGSLVLKYSDAILPISNQIGEVTKANLKMNKPMFVVYIPCSLTEDRQTSNGDAPAYSSLNAESDFILTVTNFNFWTKVEPLLHAIKNITPIIEESGMKWIILGEGFFFEKFKQLAKGSVGSGTVSFLGRQDPYYYYKKAKALFYISGMDGLPNVLLEASYFRLPIVINKECDSAEFIIDGHNGIVCDFNDRHRVRDIIDKIRCDKEFLNIMSDNAHSYLHENFSLKQVSLQLEKAIKNSLANYGN